ncbi:hypothetical protein GV794_16610 [Nocardia cyriacigeorgica]|uniref:Uncharacterized protein n=1 Tax=Nocardia cyriacigeorgica TaxID=135487 RepID=A0A6P1D266_9NOCA|nr:hypothetical protein [Nocardia cyriacigeorgica]NEW39597.1 hypothetical protein [Nocardia cyriacigeorgica]NEW44655.1 hypothetical protein [Nocardia cyriacigeorgica]NEW57268.1 hypothetical protein [Nocardia cyriacigeorgica]
MGGSGLSDPQRLASVIDRIPDPTTAGYLVLLLVQHGAIDLNSAKVEFQRMLSRWVVAGPGIGRYRHPGSVEIVLGLRE